MPSLKENVVHIDTWTVSEREEIAVPFVEKEVENVVENKSGTIIHNGYAIDDYRQEIVQRAYDLGWIDFVKMIECESAFRPTVVGDQGLAYGLCQMNRKYHKIPQEYYDDWGYQLEMCYFKWTHHTKFYWPGRIIKGQKCSDYVSNRFIIN